MSSPTWEGAPEPEISLPKGFAWLRVVLRAIPIVILVFGGLALLLLIRLFERPLFGLHRPITPHITVFVCRNALRFLGIGYTKHGTPMTHNGIMVANHSSWLDIFSLNAAAPLYFVSKSEVANWPGIGWLARATGTVFIKRDKRQARAQAQLFEARLKDNHRLLFFPEGTSTDGLQVIPFKSTLFAALFSETLKTEMWVQPVSAVYLAPEGLEDRYYGWWGDMEFGIHLLRTLAASKQGRVHVLYHPPLKVADYPDRKALAVAAETCVRTGHTQLRNLNTQ